MPYREDDLRRKRKRRERIPVQPVARGGKKRQRWAINKTGDDAPFDYFYSLPDSKLLALLILISIIIVIVLLVVFRAILWPYLDEDTNSTIGTYIGVVGLPVGVILSFIVASSWSAFSNAQVKENEEATKMFALYNLIGEYPVEGAEIQDAIIIYTEEIINNEFIIMAEGIQPTLGFDLLTAIGDMIYALDPQDSRESTLYSQAITLFQEVQSLRIIRMGYVSYGIAPELWWVLILGVVVVIGMTFFLYIECFILQAVVTAMVTATLVSLLFLVIAFNFPYRGNFALDATPFQTALQNMM